MTDTCLFCEVGHMVVTSYTESVRVGRKVVQVSGLSKQVCDHCGEELVPMEMSDENLHLIERELTKTPAAVTRGMLRKFRESLDISQREASRIFGAGESSFAKWESGQANMSDPAALLVQCALNVPGVKDYLAKLAGVEIHKIEKEEKMHGESFSEKKGETLKLVISNPSPSRSHSVVINKEYGYWDTGWSSTKVSRIA